jgi:protein-tyrosine phosphatase
MEHIFLLTGGKITPIIDNLFLSCCFGAVNTNTIKQNKIDCIVKMYGNSDSNGIYKYHPGITYLEIDAYDVPNYRISQHFVECFKFINDNIKNKKNVLVHCHAGISRSSTIVIMYLMVKYKITMQKAYEYVKSKRPIVQPNRGFFAELQRLDKFLEKNTKK